MLEFSKLMLQYIPFFRIYTNYTDQYEDASILLKHLKKTSSKFLSFIKVREFCLRAKLDQLRSAPIQRIPRYMLLIKEMLKITPVESPNFYPLKFAFEEVQKISEKISDSIANAASKKEVFYLQNVIFKGKVDLVTSSRFCIRYAMMRKWTESKKPSSKEYFFILFDDCLCYALLSRDKKSAVMTHVLPLGRLMLEILPNSASRSNAFKIITSHKTIIVEASNEAVMNDWIQDLMTFCLLLESNYKTLSKSFPCGDELEKRVFETAAHHHSRSSMYASTKEASKKHSVIKNDSVLLLTEKQRQKFTRTARATLSSHNVTSMARRISATRRSLFITSFNRNIDMRSRIQEVV